MRVPARFVHARSFGFWVRLLCGCLIVSALSFATLPARAVDAEADARAAFAKWKAAMAKRDQAKKDLKKAQDELAAAMATSKLDGKITEGEQKLIKGRSDEVAKAEAALNAAEDELYQARLELEKAIAALPDDSPLKKELIRQRNALTSSEGDRVISQMVANGLRTLTFDTKPGRIVVNLPDEMRAGDTISGTVIAEPKGKTQEEREKNRSELEGLVFEIKDFSFGVENPTTIRPAIGGTTVDRISISNNQRFSFGIPPGTSRTPADKIVVRFLLVDPTSNNATPPMFEIKDFSFDVVNRTTIGSATGGSAGRPTVSDFKIPTLGQTGRPVVITGPFDGDSSNTKVDFRPGPLQASGPTGSGTPVVGDWNGSVPNIAAESPGKIVFTPPSNATGPMEIRVKEGTTEVKGTFRNVGVNLSAPKTNLLKGESTMVTVQVQGLQGITQAVPLHLTKTGVVSMQGGDSQTMSIKPSDVQSNGTYTTTRTITGQQTGGFSVTATVVTFDTCLQDDGDPLRVLLFNVATGDFVFCQGRGESTSNKPIEISTFPFGNDFTGGVRVQAGDGIDSAMKRGAVSIGPGTSIYRNGQITHADFNFTAAQIHVELNGADYSGTATINSPKSKQTFTIHDRDTRNNTCSCSDVIPKTGTILWTRHSTRPNTCATC